MKRIEFLGSSLTVIRRFPDIARAALEGHEKVSMMKSKTTFDSVWEALEDDPIRVRNLKLRSELLMRIADELGNRDLTQVQAARLLHITQPRVSALMQGKIESFRLDSLIDFAHRLGLRVSLEVAA